MVHYLLVRKDSFSSVHTPHLLASPHQTVDNHPDCFWLLVIWGQHLEVWTLRVIYTVVTHTSIRKTKPGLVMVSQEQLLICRPTSKRVSQLLHQSSGPSQRSLHFAQ